MARVRYVAVGRIGRPHGLSGEVRVDPGAGATVDFGRYTRFFVGREDEPRPVALETIRPHGRATLFKFCGIDAPEAARALTGSILYVDRAEMPPLAEDEYYHADLLGCSVVGDGGEALGVVDDVLSTAAHDVLVIASGRDSWLLPVLATTVLEVDAESAVIRVRVPEGLPR